ncbi:SRPR [Hepatospora eriocheir]|uniref:Signal recognition particle receptor subunit alpha homolog n=1 Tax=Hepatospora eriocheir TaxID=1081669 RepID=A0A1X0QK63_9MICR|nr:SRPR [Hepatospora eriocheir]
MKNNFYFIVFETSGIVKYSKGNKPIFINNFIANMDPDTQLKSSLKVRDKFVEYEVRGPIVYLSVCNKPILNELLNKFDCEKNEFIEEKQSIEVKEKSELDFSVSEDTSSFTTIKNIIASSVIKLQNKTFSLFTGRISLDELERIILNHLIERNVTLEYANLVVNDVIAHFKYNNETRVSQDRFRDALKDSIKRLLLIRNQKDFLESINLKKGVFSICFVGPNGVGKSTTLAKISNYLLKEKFKVYIAACDTFRSGAIEQLKIHVGRFRNDGYDVGFYEGGYSKDDANVAKTAIIKAGKENNDVILIDTAGRMHNKVTLMNSLTKLIKNNDPDHIIFVGEALTGGDCLEQIQEFNKHIGKGIHNRKIDSIILTKVEAVNEKVGNILNLTLSTGIPILFLGTGQTNEDLIPVDSNSIVNLLLN